LLLNVTSADVKYCKDLHRLAARFPSRSSTFIFSPDSVITAVGMADEIAIMITAVILAVGVMLFSAEPISSFVNRHPTVKVLALSFLLPMGVSLVGEGLGMHMPKGYICFAMGFSVVVESINLRVRRVAAPVHLHEPYV
jgi:predicted tellurium resistance membrane protein TerC